MLTDFIEEINGYLCLTQEEYTRAQKLIHPARCLFEYGEAKEGYIAHKICKIKLQNSSIPKVMAGSICGYFWSQYAAMADNSLDVTEMNVKPGGKQSEVLENELCKIGILKGLWVVLQERGIDTSPMNEDQMRDFKVILILNMKSTELSICWLKNINASSIQLDECGFKHNDILKHIKIQHSFTT